MSQKGDWLSIAYEWEGGEGKWGREEDRRDEEEIFP